MSPEEVIRQAVPTLEGIESEVAEIRQHGQSLFAIYRVTLNGGEQLAVKVMSSYSMARTEAHGLATIRMSGARAPKVFGTCELDGVALLCMQFIEGATRTGHKQDLIKSLEKLYGVTSDQFGWTEDNFIGSLPQPNRRFAAFTDYWWQSRLEPQFRLAVDKQLLDVADAAKAESILAKRAREWSLNRIAPRLIHGDLWNGNILEGSDGAYLIDPAISYGNVEQDLAMQQLFSSTLRLRDLESLAERFGVGRGLTGRIPFWQLYPLLVHVNLFGGSYIQNTRHVLSLY